MLRPNQGRPCNAPNTAKGSETMGKTRRVPGDNHAPKTIPYQIADRPSATKARCNLN